MRASISLSFVSLFRRAAVLVLLLFVAAVSYAQITPSQDAYTNSADPTTNYGVAVTLGVVNTTASIQTTYIQFDLSSIPAGYTSSNIAKATLKLYVNTVTTAGSFNIDFVNGTWTEKKITSSLAPALGTTIVSSVPLTSANAKDYLLLDITSAVGAWLNGTQANDGIALVANSPLSATFDSKENTAQSHPPELDIVFAGIAGVATASGSGLIGGGTSGTLNLSLTNACAANQVLQWNGTAWVCAAVGTGTITGVTAGTDLTGGGTSGNVTLNLDITKVPQLGTANTFTGNQTVNGNLSATGFVTGAAFDIGSNLFAFGSLANTNALLGFAGNTTMTGTNNTGAGVWALANNTTGGSNTASGTGALGNNTTGSNNTADGIWALNNNTTGSGNTAIGNGALIANTTASGNTAIGGNTLGTNTTGSANTATGSAALFANTTGYSNTATGNGALGANTTGSTNTATGLLSLMNNTTGGWNTAGGANSLNNTTSGTFNTGFGTNALYYNATGSQNTALGFGAGPDQNSTNLFNSTAIGAGAVVSESNAIVLGCINGVNGCTGVNVGIGTATPAYALDVHGRGNFTGLVNFASGQTFPGTGTITGVTTAAGSGLTGGGTKGTLKLGLLTSCAANQVLQWSGSAWACSSAGSGTITGVTAGTDLTGGGTSGNVTLNLDTTQVPQLSSANTFTGTQTINNNVTITGTGSGDAVSVRGSGAYVVLAENTGGLYGLAGMGSAGVVGFTGSNGSMGVLAQDQTSGGAYAVYAYNVNDENGTGVGVYAGSSTGNGTAGYFQGNVQVTGTLTSGVKDFKIDHPLDPANKYLVHASVESSEMANIYSGNVILDEKGTAWITLPDYFGALNRDFRYQLTAVGAPGPNLYVAQEIANNRFQIAGGTPGGKVSWQVTGIRQDAYAKAHPIIPEVAKTGEERGKYLHPVEHGLPKSMGIDENRRAKMLAQHPEPPKLSQQPPVPAQPRTKPPVPPQHVAVPEPSK